MEIYQKLVTVAAPGADSGGETGSVVTLVLASGEAKELVETRILSVT